MDIFWYSNLRIIKITMLYDGMVFLIRKHCYYLINMKLDSIITFSYARKNKTAIYIKEKLHLCLICPTYDKMKYIIRV